MSKEKYNSRNSKKEPKKDEHKKSKTKLKLKKKSLIQRLILQIKVRNLRLQKSLKQN